jgi:ketosteroid isomerase-like protein
MKVPELVSGIFIGGFQKENESNTDSGAKEPRTEACFEHGDCAFASANLLLEVTKKDFSTERSFLFV